MKKEIEKIHDQVKILKEQWKALKISIQRKGTEQILKTIIQ